jgi:alkaline phosphatase D
LPSTGTASTTAAPPARWGARAPHPAVASEFVATSITSQPPPEDRIQATLRENPHIHCATGEHRGYLRLTVTPERLTGDLRGVAGVRERDAACETVASFVVEDGVPGPMSA